MIPPALSHMAAGHRPSVEFGACGLRECGIGRGGCLQGVAGRLKVKLIGKSHAVASMEVLVFVSSG